MNPALIIAVISLGLTLVLFFYFRWYLRRRYTGTELLAEYRTEVQRLIADIDLATDRDSLIVEARIKTLKSLLEDTDKRIAVYIKELERGRSSSALYASSELRVTAAFPPANALPPEVQPAAAQPSAVQNAAGTAAPPEPELPAASGKRGPGRKSASAPAGKQDIRVQIAELAVQGHSTSRIASKLKISVSEVELALNLLRK